MKKVFKILIVALIVFCAILIGRKIYYTKVGIGPEELYLSKQSSKEEFKMNKGAYQWDDKGMQVIADSISPLEIHFINSIEVSSNDKLYFNDYGWTMVNAFVILQQDKKEIARIPIETNLEENYIVVPDIVAGEYIIQINLESENGKVWYATKINITE